MRSKRLVAVVLGVVALATTACTPREVRLWEKWYAEDPDAAMEFALNLPSQDAQPQAVQSNSSVWDRLAQCESGGNWSINTGNGYYGGLQFLPSTWRANGGSGMLHQNSREEQIRVAENLRAQAGFSPWPACSRKLGL